MAGGHASGATFEELRSRHAADRDAALPRYLAQLQWSATQLRAERERRMQVLLSTAKARSSWHRERLRDVDVATFTEADLPSLPTMSKADLMDNFDAVVTDPRLTRDIVDAYVEQLPENPYLFDRYLVIASGGSSGRRGVFVYDWDGFVTFSCQIARWLSALPDAPRPRTSMRPAVRTSHGSRSSCFHGRATRTSFLHSQSRRS